MQFAPLIKWLGGLTAYSWVNTFRRIILPIYDRMSSVCLQTGGAIVIVGAANTAAKTGAAITYYVANGVLRTIAGGTTLAAYSGTVVNTQFGIFCWFADSGGTVTSAFGGSFATLALAQWPQFPIGKAMLGFSIINPTGTGNFVGGTTQLDDATVVPNAIYVSVTEGFDPYCLIGGQLTNS